MATEVNYIHGFTAIGSIDTRTLSTNPFVLSDSDFYLWASRYSLFTRWLNEPTNKRGGISYLTSHYLKPENRFATISRFAAQPLTEKIGSTSFGPWLLWFQLHRQNKTLNDIAAMFESVQSAANETGFAGAYFLYCWANDNWLRRLNPETSQRIEFKKSEQMKTFNEICETIKVPADILFTFMERNLRRATGKNISELLDDIANRKPIHRNIVRTGNAIEDQKARGGAMLLSGTPHIGEPITAALIITAVTALLSFLAKVVPSADKIKYQPKAEFAPNPADFTKSGTGTNNNNTRPNNNDNNSDDNTPILLWLAALGAAVYFFGDDIF